MLGNFKRVAGRKSKVRTGKHLMHMVKAAINSSRESSYPAPLGSHLRTVINIKFLCISMTLSYF